MYSKILSIVLIFGYLISAQEAIPKYNPKRLIVKFSESSDIYRTIRQIPVLNYSDKIEIERVIDKPEVFSFFNEYKISSIKPAKLSASEAYLTVDKIYFFDFQNNEALENSLVRLRLLTDFDYVEYDWIISSNGYEIPSGLNPESILPNDPGFGNQWGLRNTGQNFGGITGSPGADINITSAWDFTTGNSSTIISVLDSGIPLTAADFSGRILPGYDFANNDNDPSDDHGHGTNVTSIAAAAGNNSIGIAGVNWNCKIIPIKILNANNSGLYSWFISGIIMAVDSGAKVLNMSVGGNSFSQGLQDAINYALNSGRIVVACMMNENNEVTFYPAGFNNVISIGALNNIDNRAVPFCWGGGSSYGNHIDFVAPGDWILGLNFQNPTQTTYWCGTSQATPMVVGLISLMLGLDPSLNLQQIYDKIKLFAHDQIGNPSEDTPGWDKYYGWGRIDAHAVIQSIVPVELISFIAEKAGENISLKWSTAAEINNSGFDIEKNIIDSWIKIGFVSGYGTTSENHDYNFVDNDVKNYGLIKYRLKQIDYDGSYKFSKEISVNVNSLSSFYLEQNYPNPFNPVTKISYSVPQSGFINLKVYDVLGNEIRTLVSEEKPAGYYEIEFSAKGRSASGGDASDLSSGIYIYQLRTSDFISSKKMLLLK